LRTSAKPKAGKLLLTIPTSSSDYPNINAYALAFKEINWNFEQISPWLCRTELELVRRFLEGLDDEYHDFVAFYRTRLFTEVKGQMLDSDERIGVIPITELVSAAIIEENRLKLRKTIWAIRGYALSQIAQRGFVDFTTQASTEPLANTTDGMIKNFGPCSKCGGSGFEGMFKLMELPPIVEDNISDLCLNCDGL
jgi:hypothetical protein